MVRRLVQQQGGRLRAARAGAEHDARELDAAALPAGQCREGLREHAVGQAEVGADAGGVALGRVPAERSEALLELAVAAHERAVVGTLRELHLDLGDVCDELVEAASGQDTVASRYGQIAGARILREVADRPGARDRTGVRQALAGQDAQARGLSGAVAPDQADTVTGLHAQCRRFEQDARAGAQLEICGCDHG